MAFDAPQAPDARTYAIFYRYQETAQSALALYLRAAPGSTEQELVGVEVNGIVHFRSHAEGREWVRAMWISAQETSVRRINKKWRDKLAARNQAVDGVVGRLANRLTYEQARRRELRGYLGTVRRNMRQARAQIGWPDPAFVELRGVTS